MIVCSKAGYRYGSKALVIKALKPVLQPAANSVSMLRSMIQKSREGIARSESIRMEIRADTIRTSLAGTLRRLRRDRLDLLLLHDPSAESLHAENQSVLDALKQEGLIGQWGVSTGDTAVAHRALELENLGVLQVPLEPDWVEEAGDLFSKCLAAGIPVIANRVLTPIRAGAPSSAVEAQRRIEQCFTFALSQPAVRMVLCGSTKAAHLRANVKSMHHVLQSAAASDPNRS
jgi:aryl-alcohol dehydrogenase-like predicted oxidoreductase